MNELAVIIGHFQFLKTALITRFADLKLPERKRLD